MRLGNDFEYLSEKGAKLSTMDSLNLPSEVPSGLALDFSPLDLAVAPVSVITPGIFHWIFIYGL
jgi:hypothetical protein